MSIKEIVKKIIRGHKYSSDTYISYLRSIGVKIGEDVTIYAPSKTTIDEQYPWMISIGNHVRITEGVKILTHDYAWSVFKCMNISCDYVGSILGASGHVDIGNNVFIGIDCIITRNVKIGDNVIIGTGSVVTKECEANSVYAGVPAKKIMSIDEYYKKRKDSQITEAVELAKQYYLRYRCIPKQETFNEYFMLFTKYDEEQSLDVFSQKTKLGGNQEKSIEYLKLHEPFFNSYSEFIRYCFPDM